MNSVLNCPIIVDEHGSRVVHQGNLANYLKKRMILYPKMVQNKAKDKIL